MERKRTVMSVREMGKMLGLGKTDSYWLVNKRYFKTLLINGKTYVDVDSFEEWYDNQLRYQKIDGDRPGKNIEKDTYSIKDVADILGVTESTVYRIINVKKIPAEVIDQKTRIPKEKFDAWYFLQDQYKSNGSPKDPSPFLSVKDAARLAGISRQAIMKHLGHDLEAIKAGGKILIYKETFYKWIEKKQGGEHGNDHRTQR